MKNVNENGVITGFQYGCRLPYYRGVVFSLVGDTVLTVDGEQIPQELMTVTLSGGTFKKTEMDEITDKKWEFGETGTITVQKPGGLKPGLHKFSVRQHMRISYVPGGFWGSTEKEIEVK